MNSISVGAYGKYDRGAYQTAALGNHGHREGEIHHHKHPEPMVRQSKCRLKACYLNVRDDEVHSQSLNVMLGDIFSHSSGHKIRVQRLWKGERAEGRCLIPSHTHELTVYLKHPGGWTLEERATEEKSTDNVRDVRIGDILYGRILYGRPCEVQINRTSEKGGYAEAIGHCSSCDCEHVIDLNRYRRGEGPWHPATKTASDTHHRCKLTCGSFPREYSCLNCGIKHSCNHDNTMCDRFQIQCPGCNASINHYGRNDSYARIWLGPSTNEWTCFDCRTPLIANPINSSSDQLTLPTEENTVSTTKTYKISTLIEHVQAHLDAVNTFNETVEAYNDHHESAYLDKIKNYLDTGKFTDVNDNEIDHSDKTLQERVQFLQMSDFRSPRANKDTSDETAKISLRSLEALDGDTVELADYEAKHYLEYAESAERITEYAKKYEIDE